MIRLHLSNGLQVVYTGDTDDDLEHMVRRGASLPCRFDFTLPGKQRVLIVNGAQVVAIERR